MDNDKQKSTENNSSARPGIFSTPDLTIDTEKLAQAAQSTDANKARIASVFANTDATRQAQQSAITSAPLEGDVIINNIPKKRRKWIVAIIIAAILVIIAVIIMVIIASQKKNSVTTVSSEQAFNDYYQLLTVGPADIANSNSEEWFLFSLPNQLDMGLNQKDQYIDDLISRFKLFNDTMASTSDLEVYSSLLQQVAYSIYPSALSGIIVDKYLKDNSSRTAYQLIDRLAPERSEGQINYFSITSGLRRYALAELNLVELYATNGCIKDGNLEYVCTQNLLESDRTTVNDLLRQEEGALAAIKRVIVLDKSQFAYRTQKLKEAIDGGNYE